MNRLMALYEESSLIGHPSTKGTLREQYLIEFLAQMLPRSMAVSGGFICDLTGAVSRQLDIIVIDESTAVPPAFLRPGTALVPVESAIATIEVKSRLDKNALKQLLDQSQSVWALEPHPESAELGRFVILNFAIAFDTDLSRRSIERWLQRQDPTYAVWVVGKFLIRKGPTGLVMTESDDDWSDALVFFSGLFDGINRTKKKRRAHPSLDILRLYIVGVPGDKGPDA